VFDLETLEPEAAFRYPGEGWGLTTGPDALYMSDGTAEIRRLDPDTLEETGRFEVTAGGAPLHRINELEWIEGEIWANVWMTDRIARIDPDSGVVSSWIDLTGLRQDGPSGNDDVLNGIAWDAETGRVFVTGKLWPHVYEIAVTVAE
jgi:glutaminyl-peptide cyclotransferase